ncbi:MAG: chemotaxis-specific protein-glutamate methyltransferase CheB [Nitrospinales bacterium]
MAKLKGLIVDDSKLVQDVLGMILSFNDEIEIIGVADNGQEAIEKTNELKPDFITMDVNMPVMDGITAIGHIMESNPTPIIVVSDASDAETAFNAVSKGAVEVFSKSALQPENSEQLVRTVTLLARVNVMRAMKEKETEAEPKKPQKQEQGKQEGGKAISLASATGGLRALSLILAKLPSDFAIPVLIAHHIADGFVSGLVEWLSRVSPLKIKEGKEGEKVAPGTAYVAPANRHMEIDGNEKIAFVESKITEPYCPSSDRLFSSVASVFGMNSIGVILTGMGNDGTMGIQKIKEKNGVTIAQDQESSYVFDMPKSAIESGCVDEILPLEDIGQRLNQLAVSGN